MATAPHISALPRTRKTWKQRLGKKLLAHVQETTQRSTLGEIRRNIADQRARIVRCFDCDRIALKLGLKVTA